MLIAVEANLLMISAPAVLRIQLALRGARRKLPGDRCRLPILDALAGWKTVPDRRPGLPVRLSIERDDTWGGGQITSPHTRQPQGMRGGCEVVERVVRSRYPSPTLQHPLGLRLLPVQRCKRDRDCTDDICKEKLVESTISNKYCLSHPWPICISAHNLQ
jgi:hypothetical protein